MTHSTQQETEEAIIAHGKYWHTMTKPQQRSCAQLWNNGKCGEPSYLRFRRRFRQFGYNPKRAVPELGSYFDGPIPAGLFIGIETDGHAHKGAEQWQIQSLISTY